MPRNVRFSDSRDNRQNMQPSTQRQSQVNPPDKRPALEILNEMPAELGIREPEPPPPTRQEELQNMAIAIGKHLYQMVFNSFLWGFAVMGLVFLGISLVRAYNDDFHYGNIFTIAVFIYWIMHFIALGLGQVYGLFERADEACKCPNASMKVDEDAERARTLNPKRNCNFTAAEESNALFYKLQAKIIKNQMKTGEMLEKIYGEEQKFNCPPPVEDPVEDAKKKADDLLKLCQVCDDKEDQTDYQSFMSSPSLPPSSESLPPGDYCEYHRGVRPTRSSNLEMTDHPLPPNEGNYENDDAPAYAWCSHDDHVWDRQEYLDEEERRIDKEIAASLGKCTCGPSISSAMMAQPHSKNQKSESKPEVDMYSKDAEGRQLRRFRRKDFLKNHPATNLIPTREENPKTRYQYWQDDQGELEVKPIDMNKFFNLAKEKEDSQAEDENLQSTSQKQRVNLPKEKGYLKKEKANPKPKSRASINEESSLNIHQETDNLPEEHQNIPPSERENSPAETETVNLAQPRRSSQISTKSIPKDAGTSQTEQNQVTTAATDNLSTEQVHLPNETDNLPKEDAK